MKKKILAIVLCVAMLAIAIVGGTMAYFTDTKANTNTMTLGSVKIEQWEYERELGKDGNYKTATVDDQTSYVLKGFTQNKPLLPIVGDPSESGSAFKGWDTTTVRMSQVGSYGGMQVFAGKVAQDKFVVVKNTGKSDAYVRTLVAIEVGEGNPELIGTSHHNTWKKGASVTAEIDGITYYVREYVYQGGELSDGTWRHENGALTAGDTAYPSLCQVYLKHNATNEDAAKLDPAGDGLNIVVLTQAVQVSGFDDAQTALDTAFGEFNVANVADWFTAE